MKPRLLPPELLAIYRAQEMRGEQLVNWIRTCFVLLSAAMLAGLWEINTDGANRIYTVQLALWGLYSVALHVYFRLRPGAYLRRLKYVSITVDLALLTLAAPGGAVNHSGIIEYFHGFTPPVYALWNLMSCFRFRVNACLYSAALTALLNGGVLWTAVATGAIGVSATSVYGAHAVNLGDQATQIVFMALPGLVAAVVARTSRNLLLRAEEESLARARLEGEKERLGKYMSKDVVEFVLSDPRRLELGGTRRVATVLFADIRNFTALAESVEPERVVGLLNEYFGEMVDIVFRHGGMLDKFLGDGLMAVFGTPVELDRAPLRAVLAAVEMTRALERVNERNAAAGIRAIDIGVGIATGPVVSGNIGSPQRMEYTSIGDTVNYASRLEALNKELGTRILICKTTFEAADGVIPARALPPRSVRGRQEVSTLFAVEDSAITDEQLADLGALFGPRA